MFPNTGVAAARLADALETQTQLLREEQGRTARIDQHIGELQKALAECARERDDSAKRQAISSQTIAYLQDLLRLAVEPPPPGPKPEAAAPSQTAAPTPPLDGKPKLVARLGEQHYRMLHALRAKGPMSLDDLAIASVTSARRAKVQMAEDSEAGREIIAVNGDNYELTPTGADLLRRFEDFRRTTGKGLPSLDAPHSDADRDEADPATPNEEDAG